DAAAGDDLVDLHARLRVQPRPPVGQIIAGDAGDGRVPQAHPGHRLGDAPWLVGVERLGLAGGDLAEIAPAGALVAADQERGLAVLPALEDVGTAGLLADRVQALAPDQLLQLGVLRAHPQPGLDPGRLALDRNLAVARLDPQQPPFSWCQYHA